MIAFLAVGVLFIIGGALIRPRPRPDELRARGTVAESWFGYAFGEPAWLYTAEFRDAEGTVWRFQPPLSSGRQRAVGDPVEVAYSPADPQATARVTDGLGGYLHWVLMGVGAAAAVGSLFVG